MCGNWVLLQTNWHATSAVDNSNDLLDDYRKKWLNGSKPTVCSDVFINLFLSIFSRTI